MNEIIEEKEDSVEAVAETEKVVEQVDDESVKEPEKTEIAAVEEAKADGENDEKSEESTVEVKTTSASRRKTEKSKKPSTKKTETPSIEEKVEASGSGSDGRTLGSDGSDSEEGSSVPRTSVGSSGGNSTGAPTGPVNPNKAKIDIVKYRRTGRKIPIK